MPEGPDGKTIIIVKKVSGHGGHHGGAWKVAYADFVTAMMALFMVLWLVNSASVPVRQRIASYFREPGVFEMGSGTPLELGGAGILQEAFAPPSDENSRISASQKLYEVESTRGEELESFEPGEDQVALPGGEAQRTEVMTKMDKIAKDLKKAMNEVMIQGGAGGESGKLLGKVDVKVDQKGLHIEIMDTEKASMFERGSSRVKPTAEVQLKKISEILAQLPNPIDIEGHTDAVPYSSEMRDRYDNWDLSTDRANAARRALLSAGIKENQISRVVGFAAQRLKYPKEPENPSNRRISISMRFTEMAAETLKQTKAVTTVPRLIGSPDPEAKADTKTEEGIKKLESLATVKPSASPAGAESGAAIPSPARSNQLSITVDRSLPEDSPVPDAPVAAQPGPKGEAEDSDEPQWQNKDKIFGGKDPFAIR